MIIDYIQNSDAYLSMGERIAQALKYISETDFASMEKGKYAIDGETIYAVVNEYDTKPVSECKIEAHQKYIDIQYIVSGEEAMGVKLLKDQKPSVAYDMEKDCAFYEESTSLINFEAGMFAIYFPHDLHQPGVSIGEGSTIKKVVVKVKV